MMKPTFIVLLVVMTLAIPLILIACTNNSTESVPEISETTTPAETSPVVIDYAGLGLTEEQILLLKERGIANVDSAEVASKIAGFEVAEPSYVPEGFSRGKFMVSLSAAGMPEEMKPKFNNTQIQSSYTYQGDRNNTIALIQMVHRSSLAGGEPAEICGRPAERSFSKADQQNPLRGDSVTYIWEIDGNYFTLSGFLGDTLDEETLIKMACSISID